MTDYKKYLAENILVENKPITYRLLSRALACHVDLAKHMLHDFHKYQNGIRPESVHATYLVYGTRSVDESSDNGDVEMGSSIPEAEADPVPTLTLSLVQEEKLDYLLSEYHHVLSIHIYSLGPHPAKDLQLLPEVARQAAELSLANGSCDPIQSYGGISNPRMKRRDRRAENPKAAVPSANVRPGVSQMLSSSGEKEPAGSSGENLASRVAEKKAVPAVNRGGSGIMESFAKAAGKPAKAKSTPDPPMKAMSDDGEDELDAVPQPKKLTDGDATRRTRKDREAELRRMMEEEDDETDVKAEDSQSGATTPDNGMMEEASTATSETEKETKPAVEILPNAGDGRRRGKRKVMKKKQVMDEEGFLVTIQEPVWESFSEDEVQPPPKAKSTAPSSSAGSVKAKKQAGKGQGSIMSFFGKR